MDDRFQVLDNGIYFTIDLGMMKVYRYNEIASGQWPIKVVNDKMFYHSKNNDIWIPLDKQFNEAYCEHILNASIENELNDDYIWC